MTINDLNIGSIVVLGAFYPGGSPSNALMDVIWRKVSRENDFVSEQNVGIFKMDEPERENANRDRRDRGSNFFPQTNLFQYLNAVGREWFVPAHETDEPPTYARFPGFLSNFETWELDAIEPHETVVLVPDGFRREFGAQHAKMCRVSLPSLSEIGRAENDDQEAEGTPFEYGVADRRIRDTWLRTARASGFYIIDPYGDLRPVVPKDRFSVRPLIRIKRDCPVEDRPDNEGLFYTLPPDGSPSNINLNEFFQCITE